MPHPLIAALLLMQAGAATLPLPDRADIPANMAMLSCPDDAAAKTMLDRYFVVAPAPNNTDIVVPTYMDGLKVTGCRQEKEAIQGVVRIQSVQQRRSIFLAGGAERYIRFRGKDEAGRPIVGIVSEDLNNRYPRGEVAEWMEGRSPDGWLDARHNPDDKVFLRCTTPEQALRAVKGLRSGNMVRPGRFRRAFLAHAAKFGCRPADGRYQITAILGNVGNACGDECYFDLTALAAKDRSGARVGLIYDGSLL